MMMMLPICLIALISIETFVSAAVPNYCPVIEKYILRLQNWCQRPTLQYHGFWADPCDCDSQQDFATNSISPDVLAWMNQNWQACGQTNPSLWKHEWDTHGKCTGLSVNDYFTLAMNVFKSQSARLNKATCNQKGRNNDECLVVLSRGDVDAYLNGVVLSMPLFEITEESYSPFGIHVFIGLVSIIMMVSALFTFCNPNKVRAMFTTVRQKEEGFRVVPVVAATAAKSPTASPSFATNTNPSNQPTMSPTSASPSFAHTITTIMEPKEAKDTAKRAKYDKPKSKRFLSPYIVFCSEKRPELKAAHPNASFEELGKMLGQMWAQLDEKAKDAYKKEAPL